MARMSKEYEKRKSEILDTAKSLFFSHGYEKTTVNMVIDSVDISKGTFYYYFESKEDLLETLATRMTEDLVAKIREALEQPGLTAIDKINRFIEVGIREKAVKHRRLILLFLGVMYSDENVRLRDKLNTAGIELTKPLIIPVVRQGIEEGVFDTPYPAEAAEMILGLGNTVRRQVAALLLALSREPELWGALEKKVRSYVDAMERILGAPRGCITTFDMDVYREFLKPLEEEENGTST